MHLTVKRKLVVGIIALAAAAFAGGAYAANQDSKADSRQAFLRDVAKRLNVTPQQLRKAMQGAFLDQLSAAVAAGRLTQAEANRIRQRVQSGGFVPGAFGGGWRLQRRFLPPPGVLVPGPGAPGPGVVVPGRFAAAATYLGMTRQRLLAQLAAGKSLAQLAQARGKSVSGLKSAMLAAVKARLDKAVSAKLITAAQEQQVLAKLPSRLSAEINRKGLVQINRKGFLRPWFGPGKGPKFGPRMGRGFSPPPGSGPGGPLPGPASLPPAPLASGPVY